MVFHAALGNLIDNFSKKEPLEIVVLFKFKQG